VSRGDVGGDPTQASAGATVTTTVSMTGQTTAKSPSRTRTASTPAGAQSDDEVIAAATFS